MKKLLFLFLLPSFAMADRLGSLKSNADVLLTTQAVAVSGGGGNIVNTATQYDISYFSAPGSSTTQSGNDNFYWNTQYSQIHCNNSDGNACFLANDNQFSGNSGTGYGVYAQEVNHNQNIAFHAVASQSLGGSVNNIGYEAAVSGGNNSGISVPNDYGVNVLISDPHLYSNGFGIYSSVTSNGANSINTGGYFNAQNGGTNYGIYVANGSENFQNLTASAYVKTDNLKNLVSYDPSKNGIVASSGTFGLVPTSSATVIGQVTDFNSYGGISFASNTLVLATMGIMGNNTNTIINSQTGGVLDFDVALANKMRVTTTATSVSVPLTVLQGLYIATNTVSASYTIKSTDTFILASGSISGTGIQTYTLPSAASACLGGSGQTVQITKVDTSTGVVKVVPTGADLLFGTTGQYIENAVGQTCQFFSDCNSKWWQGGVCQLTPSALFNAIEGSGGVASPTLNAANDIMVFLAYTSVPVNIQKVRYPMSATTTGVVDFGIYDLNGTRLSNTGGVTNPGASTVDTSTLTVVNLPAGYYYLAGTASANTITFSGMAGSGNGVGIGLLAATASGGILPATITPANITAQTGGKGLISFELLVSGGAIF